MLPNGTSQSRDLEHGTLDKLTSALQGCTKFVGRLLHVDSGRGLGARDCDCDGVTVEHGLEAFVQFSLIFAVGGAAMRSTQFSPSQKPILQLPAYEHILRVMDTMENKTAMCAHERRSHL